MYGRFHTVSYFEIDPLERDALEVLSLVRFMKNTFTFVNRITPKLLSLIPNHREDSGEGGGSITLTPYSS
jgi:hypothetical protein